MIEPIFFALSCLLAIGMGAICLKFVLLCQEAREEEFEDRRKAMVPASRATR